MKTLYFDCFSGIAGDMTIGALLDLGLDFEYLQSELRKLPLDGYTLKASRVVRANLSAMKFDVVMEGATQAHSHDPHEHSHSHSPGHEHPHDHSHHHAHEPGPASDADAGQHHFHRKASQILEMIQDSALHANVKRIAGAIFTKLAISEGMVHHVAPGDVEFHEVGAIDSIIDTVGSAIGLDALGIERFRCSAINVGGGFIHCQHGVYPVPTPATADLLKAATIYSRHVNTELVTPTGAAILAAVVDQFAPLDGFVIERIGYGAGTKQFDQFPNCLRLLIGEETTARNVSVPLVEPNGDEITVIEANIDDMIPQNFAYVMERLLEAGALDVFTSPIQMKKSRSGQLLQILAPPDKAGRLCDIVFRETTTIGLRKHTARRTILEREQISVTTPYGVVAVKISKMAGRIVNVAPEFEDCARLARSSGVALKEIQAAALQAFSSDSR